ncbi:MAG: site-specific DNA-methyltransferase [Candidatus Kapabacteria bacterium]|nr:site-specific DNA-methyltransferase [Candidatus Kapabacteria bacterium]
MNQLILGDNLEIMRKMDSESIDLIYLDPPFFSNRNYEVIWGDKGEVRSFEDRWSGGVDHYIAWLKERVAEMHRLLKPTGSIYLHCDWHADAYIRVFILDKLFGENNFRNKITWKRATTHNDSKQGAKHFGRVCDYIFLYNKDYRLAKFNTIFEDYTKEYIEASYNKIDSKTGQHFKASDLSAAKPGGDTYYEWNGKFPPKNRYWAYSKDNMQKFEDEGRIYYSTTGKPYLKHFIEDMPGVSIDDLWLNCNFKTKSERIGYPTQKPEALMTRVIKSASNEGDTVFDPFVGGGTTVVVADKLKRNWIGIDQSVQAVKVSEMRLNNEQNLFSAPFSVTLHRYDYDTLRYKDAFEFEKFIVEQFGGLANIKQRSDLGLDGKTREGIPIQVKRSDNIGRNVIDNFHSALMRYDKALYERNKADSLPIGFIIAFSFGKGAVQEVARLKNEENVTIKLVNVEDIIPIAKKPRLTVKINDLDSPSNKRGSGGVSLREIEFIAIGESDAGVEFYSWDFEYNEEEKKFKASIMIDKEGRQQHKFKPGTHSIAVKAVDNEGLEAIEVVKVKVNGVVERG